jgi:CheY-like chemotaxis protein
MEYNVLLIDDDRDEHVFIINAAQLISEKIGVMTMDNGENVLKYVWNCDEKHLPDFILLDINMPKLDGFMILEKLKSDYVAKRIPVYMFSTSNRLDDKNKARDLGATGYYSKPDTVDGYREIIACILSQIHHAHLQA